MSRLQKKSILRKTASVSLLLLLSKFLGIIREVVQVSYLGVGPLSDAFNAAMKIPNLLRKLFAEGALSAAFVPTIIRVTGEDSQQQASKLLTLTYIVFGALIIGLCAIISFYPEPFILLIAKGFADKPEELRIATETIRILIYFVFFVFSSALLASALQAKMHFTVPAWGPTLLNVFYIGGLLLANYLGLSVPLFSYFLLLGGLVQMLVYTAVYFRLNFSLEWPDAKTYGYFKEVLLKFIPCLLSVSIIEVNLIIDTRFASTLPAGSVTLLSLSSRFMTITLGAFAVAFSTILLPQFSRISLYAPKRLSYYLLEAAKLILWVTLPIVFWMSFFAYDIFYTIFYRLAGNFTLDQVRLGAGLLIAFLPGLFFFSINKTLLTIFYALHETRYTMYITLVGSASNVLLNRVLMPHYGAIGLALATVLAAVIQTVLLMLVLNKQLGFSVYLKSFGRFMMLYFFQLLVALGLWYGLYSFLLWWITNFLPQWSDVLLNQIGLWFWIGPLCLFVAGLLYYLRNKGGLHLYFLE
jgi:putative peptidoglycan lipid II flippase